jgi:hypothetical protein
MTANVNAQRTIAHGPGVYRLYGLHEHMKCAHHASLTEAALHAPPDQFVRRGGRMQALHLLGDITTA